MKAFKLGSCFIKRQILLAIRKFFFNTKVVSKFIIVSGDLPALNPILNLIPNG
jgi:hypothetical protein